MTNTWRLQQAIFALRSGAHRLSEADPDITVSIADDLPEESAAVRDAITGVARKAPEAKALGEMARQMARETTERAARFEARGDQLRGLVLAAMDALEERKIEAADVTVSLRAGQPSVMVTDETKVPDTYWKVERRLDKAAISADLKQGVVIEGAELSNGLPSVTIRGT